MSGDERQERGVAEENIALVAAMNAQQVQEERGNRNYDGEEKRYKVWVDKNDGERSKFGIPASKYISVDAISSYFLQVQANRAVQGRTALKCIYALNKLAIKERATHVLGGDETKTIEKRTCFRSCQSCSQQHQIKLR